MPLFLFQCTSCHQKFEELMAASATSQVRCPACDAPAFRVWNGTCTFGAKKGASCSGHCATCSCSSCGGGAR